jgi:hypothetical protein
MAPGRSGKLSTNRIDLVRSRRGGTFVGVHAIRPQAKDWSVLLASQNA